MSAPRAGERATHLSRVLQLVHRRGSISRAELVAATGLSRSAVKALVADLAGRQLVVEDDGSGTAPARNGRGAGRRSFVVSPRTDRVAVLAVDIKADTLAVAAVALGGHVRLKKRIRRRSGRFWAKDTVEDLTAIAGAALGECDQAGLEVRGVGVSFAGLVRAADGYVYVSPNMGWRDVPLARMLADRLGLDVPILVANDGDASLLGEYAQLRDPDLQHLVGVSSDIGVAGGVILHGQPWGGTYASGAEMGHMVVNPSGRPCRCGSQGCWETEIGPLALLRHAGRDPAADRVTALAELLAAADGGDPDILRALAAHGRWLGLGLATLVNLFAPERIVLGGLFARTHPHEHEFIERELQARVLAPLRERLVVAPAQLGVDSSLLGAADMAIARVIADLAGSRAGR